jgi:hypothetical protein
VIGNLYLAPNIKMLYNARSLISIPHHAYVRTYGQHHFFFSLLFCLLTSLHATCCPYNGYQMFKRCSSIDYELRASMKRSLVPET